MPHTSTQEAGCRSAFRPLPRGPVAHKPGPRNERRCSRVGGAAGSALAQHPDVMRQLHAELQALGDAPGLFPERSRSFRAEQVLGGLPPQRQPAGEVGVAVVFEEVGMVQIVQAAERPPIFVGRHGVEMQGRLDALPGGGEVRIVRQGVGIVGQDVGMVGRVALRHFELRQAIVEIADKERGPPQFAIAIAIERIERHGALCLVDSVTGVGGAPLEFPLGVGMVIQGWDEGLVGQKVGSRVLLVIPAEQAYGEAPEDTEGATAPPAHELAGETLVFVVDILGAY